MYMPPSTSRIEGRRRSAFVLATLFISLLLGVLTAAAVELRIDGERLWLQADDVPLSQVLEHFVQAGVQVKMDPALSGQVRVQVVDQDLESALADLLEPNGYVLIWDVLEGPLGAWPRLAEIQVFRPGHQDRIAPLDAVAGPLRVASWPHGEGIEYVVDELIIGFAPPADRTRISVLLRELGATLLESLPELGIYRIQLPPGTNIPALVAQLQRHPLVAAVEPNYVYRLPPAPLLAAGARDTAAAERLGASAAMGHAPVAILDSGLSAWPGLADWVAGAFNALAPGQSSDDQGGHGTQMVMIASGWVAPSGAATPVAEGVRVLGIRTFDNEGVTSNFAVMNSLFHAADQGARVINMSWGAPVHSDFLAESITRVRRGGTLLVAAVGNEPSGQPMYPAAFEAVIGVSALNERGEVWSQSNHGDFVFMAAPGQATLPGGTQGGTGLYSGTSIASAYVTHALGQFFAQHPDASAQAAQAALQQAVNPDGLPPDNFVGHGALDGAAWQRLLAP